MTTFQETEKLEDIWKEFSYDLINIIMGIKHSPFHEYLAAIHRNYDAVTLTLNFDGLLIREFVVNGNKEVEKAFSLPTKEECESFFLRHSNANSLKESLEIQARGDIFYVKCDGDGFCPQKGQQHSLWAFIASLPEKENHTMQIFFKNVMLAAKLVNLFFLFLDPTIKKKACERCLR